MRRTGKEREEIGDMGVLLDALKKKDLELASKYFEVDKQITQKTKLAS